MSKNNKMTPKEMAEANKSAEFRISTIITSEDTALIQMEWGEQQAQMTPLQARQHALSILEAADAAATEDVVIDWLKNTVKMDDQKAMGAMATLRDARAKKNGQG